MSSEVNTRIGLKIGVIGVREVLSDTFAVIHDKLHEGRVVSIAKLGTFDTKIYPAREYPSALPLIKNLIIKVPAKVVPSFKYSSYIKSSLKKKKVFYQDEETN